MPAQRGRVTRSTSRYDPLKGTNSKKTTVVPKAGRKSKTTTFATTTTTTTTRKRRATAPAEESETSTRISKRQKLAPAPRKAVAKAKVTANKRQTRVKAPKAKGTASTTTAPTSRKRKAETPAEDTTVEESVEKSTSTNKRQKRPKPRAILTHPPSSRQDVYVFGTNCYGELGLGDATKKAELPRPVLNPKLSATEVGVVHLTVGGAHSAALTHDNQILTWGINDEGTLGRDTQEELKAEEVEPNDVKGEPNGNENKDEESSNDEEEKVDLNLKEATPAAVDPSHFPEGTVFTQLVATDSATFALTNDGLVYGWGTFRNNNGVMGFTPDVKFQTKPVVIPELMDIVELAAGAQHVLALTAKGTVYTWGCSEQNKLGRRLIHRLDESRGLVPKLCALPTGIVGIGAGLYHSFAIHKKGHVYSWGSNNFGQTGIALGAGESDAAVPYPEVVYSLRHHGDIKSVTGGKDHSLAITKHGQCLTWGRVDNKALGLTADDLTSSDVICDGKGRPRILTAPTPISDVEGEIVFAVAGTDHSFAITKDGKAYSWGFNAQHQAGQPGDDEVERPNLVQNKHVKGKIFVSAAAGGQFSILTGEHITSE